MTLSPRAPGQPRRRPVSANAVEDGDWPAAQVAPPADAVVATERGALDKALALCAAQTEDSGQHRGSEVLQLQTFERCCGTVLHHGVHRVSAVDLSVPRIGAQGLKGSRPRGLPRSMFARRNNAGKSYLDPVRPESGTLLAGFQGNVAGFHRA